MKFVYRSFPKIILLLVLANNSCQKENHVIQYKKWNVISPILIAGPKGMFDDIAVKDPSIVFYNGKYHMFYTSKTARESHYGIEYVTGLGYVSSPTLEGLNNSKRYNFNAIVSNVVIAPQIFYFEPQKLWYIIAQTPMTKNKSRLAPVFMTNPNIENPNGWSKPKIIRQERPNGGFWIDFWVICDERKAHLFYTDQKGSLYKMETSIDQFPLGFANAEEKRVFSKIDKNHNSRWRLFDACHVYHVRKTGKYLAIVEGAYPHPTNKFYWDARNRFLIAIYADSLNGPWKRVEESSNEFFGDPRNLYYKEGRRGGKYTQISHFELIRSGYNQKMEINDYHFQILFEGFDGSKIPDSYNYNELPWEIVLIRNY